MPFSFGQRSLDNIDNINPDLQKLCLLAIKKSSVDFTITEGLRTLERQKQLVAEKKSQTMKSYHLTGDAIDFYPYYNGSVQVNADFAKFKSIADTFKECAKELNLKITWGGDWKSFVDGPHIQIEKQ